MLDIAKTLHDNWCPNWPDCPGNCGLHEAIDVALEAERERIADWLLANLQPRPHAMAVAAAVRKGGRENQ